MNMNAANQCAKVGNQPGEISSNILVVMEDIAELEHVLEDIEELVFFLRPTCPEKDHEPLDKGATVNCRITEIHYRINNLKSKAFEIRDAIRSQLDQDTRLV
jgi:hypothetical protein